MKRILFCLITIISIIVAGCGEESDAVKALKQASTENLRLTQSSKSNWDIARQLVENSYKTSCKISSFTEKFVAEHEKLSQEFEIAKAQGLLNFLDGTNANIFNVGKEGDKYKEKLEKPAKKLKEFEEKHKDYITAMNDYVKSIDTVRNTANKKNNENYFIADGISSKTYQLAKKNNFSEKYDFSKINMSEFVYLNDRKNQQRHSQIFVGKVIDKRAVLVKDPKSGGEIRKLNVGEIIEVLDEISEGPNIKIKVSATGEEGWVWHSYIRYGDQAIPVKPGDSQQPYIVNSAPQVKKQKMFNPIDTPQSVAIMEGVAGISSSSVLKEGNQNYSASNIIDQNNQTCWADGVPGLGIGESITLTFNQKYNISGFRIFNGYQKSEDLYYKNSRPIAFRIIGSDGSNAVYNLEDSIYEQDIYFDKMINVDSIKLVIEKVQHGTTYEDTCISEIIFF